MQEGEYLDKPKARNLEYGFSRPEPKGREIERVINPEVTDMDHVCLAGRTLSVTGDGEAGLGSGGGGRGPACGKGDCQGEKESQSLEHQQASALRTEEVS